MEKKVARQRQILLLLFTITNIFCLCFSLRLFPLLCFHLTVIWIFNLILACTLMTALNYCPNCFVNFWILFSTSHSRPTAHPGPGHNLFVHWCVLCCWSRCVRPLFHFNLLPVPWDFIVENFNNKLKNVTKPVKPKHLTQWRSKPEILKLKRQCRMAERRWRKGKLTVLYNALC